MPARAAAGGLPFTRVLVGTTDGAPRCTDVGALRTRRAWSHGRRGGARGACPRGSSRTCKDSDLSARAAAGPPAEHQPGRQLGAAMVALVGPIALAVAMLPAGTATTASGRLTAAAAETAMIPPLPPGADPLWLRYPRILNGNLLHTCRSQISSVRVSAGAVNDAVSIAQLRSAAAELGLGLSGMLGKDITPTCCIDQSDLRAARGELVVSIEADASLGKEGFRIGRSGFGGVTLEAATASGALYGSFRLLSYLQRGEAIPSNFTSTPAMALRIWNLWDVLSGEVTRGYAGRSLVWPMALYKDDAPPPRNQVFLAPCNASDPFQQWEHVAGSLSTIKNLGNGECLNQTIGKIRQALSPSPLNSSY